MVTYQFCTGDKFLNDSRIVLIWHFKYEFELKFCNFEMEGLEKLPQFLTLIYDSNPIRSRSLFLTLIQDPERHNI